MIRRPGRRRVSRPRLAAPAVTARSRSTRPGATATTRATSSAVVANPRLKRIAFCVSCGSRPIALSTCDGSRVPDEQADPVETAMPSRSKAMTSDSASMPSKPMLLVLATRASRRPLTCVPGTAASSSRFERIAHRGDAADLGEAAPGPRRRDPQADQRRDVLGAGAAAALLTAAGHLRDQPGAAPDPERARALGAGELVPGDREEVDAECRDVERQLAGRLHGVRVEQRAAGMGDGRQLGDRLDGPDLVVGVHHRHHRGAVGHRGGEGGRIDDAGPVDRQPADLPAAAGQGPGRLDDRFVLDGADDQVTPAGGLQGFGGAAQGEDVRFGAAAGEDDLGRIPADEGGDGGAGRVEPALGALPPRVDAGGVAEVVAEGTVHGVRDRRIDRRRGVVVEVEGHRFRS